MAILLTSLLFGFEISFLPKYRVNYHDYIIKWCFGISCNWCISLDNAHIFALVTTKPWPLPLTFLCQPLIQIRSVTCHVIMTSSLIKDVSDRNHIQTSFNHL